MFEDPLTRGALGSESGGNDQTNIKVNQVAALIDITNIQTRTLLFGVPMWHIWFNASSEAAIAKPRGHRVTHNIVSHHNPPTHFAHQRMSSTIRHHVLRTPFFVPMTIAACR